MRQFQPEDAGQQAQKQQDTRRADRLLTRQHSNHHGANRADPDLNRLGGAFRDRFGRPFEQAEAQKGADHKARIPGQIPETIG